MAKVDHSLEPSRLAALVGNRLSRPEPLYRSLADALRGLIDSGALPAGARLPSERALAESLRVSRTTVVGAYELLRREGRAESRRGSGTVVLPSAPSPHGRHDGRVPGGGATGLVDRMVDRREEMVSLATTPHDVVPGLVGELAAELTAVARDDLGRLAADPGYHPRGLPELRAAIGRHYEEQGVPTTPDQILVTNGATQAIGLAAQLYLRPEDLVVVESPTWPGCTDLFRMHGARLAAVPLDEEGIRPDRLHAALGEGAAMLFVMPTFHNPTGTLMSPARRRYVAELAGRFQVPLVEDHSHPADPLRRTLPVAAAAAGSAPVLTVSGLSKTVWGGLRIGWVRGPVEVVERLARLKALADMGSPLLDQVLAARLIPRLEDWAGRRETLRRERLAVLAALLAERFPTWRWEEPDGGSALWIELPDTDAGAFAALALRHGVEITPGHLTDPSGRHDSYVRLPYDQPAADLDPMVDRLQRAWLRMGP